MTAGSTRILFSLGPFAQLRFETLNISTCCRSVLLVLPSVPRQSVPLQPPTTYTLPLRLAAPLQTRLCGRSDELACNQQRFSSATRTGRNRGKKLQHHRLTQESVAESYTSTTTPAGLVCGWTIVVPVPAHMIGSECSYQLGECDRRVGHGGGRTVAVIAAEGEEQRADYGHRKLGGKGKLEKGSTESQSQVRALRQAGQVIGLAADWVGVSHLPSRMAQLLQLRAEKKHVGRATRCSTLHVMDVQRKAGKTLMPAYTVPADAIAS